MGKKLAAVTDFIFLFSKITVDGDCSHESNRLLLIGRKPMTHLDSILHSRDITLLLKVHIFKAMVFLVAMYRYKSWTIKKTKCQIIDAFKFWSWRRSSSLLDCKKIESIDPKWNQLCIFIGRTRAEAEAKAPVLWLHDAKSWFIEKDTDDGEDWRQKEKGAAED